LIFPIFYLIFGSLFYFFLKTICFMFEELHVSVRPLTIHRRNFWPVYGCDSKHVNQTLWKFYGQRKYL
jgi:hypothetical protein